VFLVDSQAAVESSSVFPFLVDGRAVVEAAAERSGALFE